MAVATAAHARAAAMAPGAGGPGNRDQNNLLYLRTAQPKQVVMTPAAGGGVVTQAWNAGSTLIWDVPTVDGGYLESIVVKCNFTVNPATGTAAAYALTKAAQYALFKEFWLELGGMQARARPFFIRILDMLSGYEKSYNERVNAGNTVAAQTAAIWSADPMPIVINTNNSWVFQFRIPLRLLPRSPAGMIPMTAGGTTGQFKLICCASPLATNTTTGDPLDNVLQPTGGTGWGVTVTGTVEALAEFRDGKGPSRVAPLPLDMNGVGTVQWFIDRQLNPLTAATLMNAPIYTKQKHIYAVSIVVDGVQTSDFALTSNIAALALGEDSSMQNAFFRYGNYGNNLTVQDFFEKFTRSSRGGIGQDIDPGVIPWVPGPFYGGTDPDNLEGNMFLNMTQQGWPDVNYAVQVSAVGAFCTPRVETYLVSVLDQGLVPAA